jgi:hypothetical protein
MIPLLTTMAALGPPDGFGAAHGVAASWWHQADAMVVLVEGPTDGWVVVGFNDHDALAGSRLVMAAITGGRAIAEEHHAEPPLHPRQRALEVLGFEEGPGITRVLVVVPRVAVTPGAVTLNPGVRCGLTLAYSAADDFDHHSTWRGMIGVTL